MTLEEAIKHAEEVAEENQRVVDTGIVFDDVTIDMLYCDDTEVIEEHLANYQKCAEEHRQLAEWLKDYKRLLEQQLCNDAISREPFMDSTICEGISCNECAFNRKDKGGCILEERVMKLPSVTPQQKMGRWIFVHPLQADDVGAYMCSCCEAGDWNLKGTEKFCPNCGAKMEVEE